MSMKYVILTFLSCIKEVLFFSSPCTLYNFPSSSVWCDCQRLSCLHESKDFTNQPWKITKTHFMATRRNLPVLISVSSSFDISFAASPAFPVTNGNTTARWDQEHVWIYKWIRNILNITKKKLRATFSLTSQVMKTSLKDWIFFHIILLRS